MATQTRTWKTAYGEVKADLDRAVARNNELAGQLDETKGLQDRNRGLSTTNSRLTQENARLNQENQRLTRELESNESELLLEERKKHKEQMEQVRDGKTTASQLLAQLAGEQKAEPTTEELLKGYKG